MISVTKTLVAMFEFALVAHSSVGSSSKLVGPMFSSTYVPVVVWYLKIVSYFDADHALAVFVILSEIAEPPFAQWR